MRKIVLVLCIGAISFATIADAGITIFEINGHQSAFTVSACGSAAPLFAHADATLNLSEGTYFYEFELMRYNTPVASESGYVESAGDWTPYSLTFREWIPAGSGIYQLHLTVNGQSEVSQIIPFTLIQSPSGPPTAWSLINGVSAWEEPIKVCSAGPIIIDVSKSSCASQYFLSIELSDRWWNRYGGEYSQWLTNAEYQQFGQPTAFDVKGWAEHHYFAFVPGQFYRVKLAVETPWNEHTKVISIQPTEPHFSINGASGGSVETLGPTWPIVMNASASSCAKSYFLSVQLSDAHGNQYGSEVMKWLDKTDLNQYGQIVNFNVKRFAEDQGLKFVAGAYYRVKLAVAGGSNETTSLIFIKPILTAGCVIKPCRGEPIQPPIP